MIKLKESELLRKNVEKIKGRRIICRVDFNVDLFKGEVLGSFRIKSILPTLKILKKAKTVVFLSHFDDPDKPSAKYSLKKLLPMIERIFKVKLSFIENFSSQPKSQFNLFENTRFFNGEKTNDLELARKFASFGEIFVNEAFSASHRCHASICGLTKILPTYYGINFEREIKLMNRALQGKKPVILILGGAKISTKLPLIKKFLSKAEIIFLGGALATTFLKSQGFEVGKSFFEKEILSELKSLFDPKIIFPQDFVVQTGKIKSLNELKHTDRILDIGPQSTKFLKTIIKEGKTIIWNGPMGYIENYKFQKGTKILAEALSKNKGFVLVGGGETLAFLEKTKLLSKFRHISTGGGAMLHYLAEESLPILK